jgi:hypothetical protein
MTFVLVWPHLEHSNFQCSKPSGPDATSVAFIRVVHLGQRGRWMGNNSGKGFVIAITAHGA